MTFTELLQDLTKRLAHVEDRATLSVWHRHFAAKWGAQAEALAASANDTLGLAGDHQVRPDIGYLAVERAQAEQRVRPWILVSANPGWGARANKKEREVKGQPDIHGPVNLEAYEAFRSAFLDRWYPEVLQADAPRSGVWWNNAARFLHTLHGLDKPAGMMALHGSFDAIGWELWPFHSTRDGFSGRIAAGNEELSAFAQASLSAAIRMEGTAGIVAASSAAERVVNTLRERNPALLHVVARDRLAVPYVRRDGRIIERKATVTRYHTEAGRPLVVIDRQIFSNWGTPPHELRELILASVLGRHMGGRGGGTDSTRVKAVANTPSPAPRCVAIGPAQPGHAVVIAVPVGQTDVIDAPDLEDEEEMHERTVGHWNCRPDGPVIRAVREAFGRGQRAFVMSRWGGTILRIYEIRPSDDGGRPATFTHPTGDGAGHVFQRIDERNGELMHAGAPFATAYRCGSSNRVRFHATPCNDEALRGVPYDIAPAGPKFFDSPKLCSFADPDDPRVSALSGP